MERIERPWAGSPEDILRNLGVSAQRGLSTAEVRQRRRQAGPNRLREAKTRGAWRILLDQVKSLVTLLLLAAGGAALAFGRAGEAAAIGAALLVNTLIGFFTELKAVRSMEALQRLSAVRTRVRREGEIRQVPAETLVPGDLVILESGELVSADLRLLEANQIQVDESTLTGESLPVDKGVEALPGDPPLAERRNLLFKGTALSRGSGEAVVISTGMETELGRISSLVEEAEEAQTPLEQRLDRLGYRLIGLTAAVGIAVAATGLLTGREILLVIETSIALAVAAIPEGLPIVATVALARGMHRLARRQALMHRLSAIETLGSTNVIFTDKTGTLTENHMTLARLALEPGSLEWDPPTAREEEKAAATGGPPMRQLVRRVLETAVLCSNASLPEKGGREDGTPSGDPLEVALLEAGRQVGIYRSELLKTRPEVREEAFDPETKMMATFHREDPGFRVAVKGAPEPLLMACRRIRTPHGLRDFTEAERRAWLKTNDELAGQGLRVIALAEKSVARESENPYEDLVFLGLAGLLDPPVPDVAEALASCREAGIRVIMLTGDHPGTARTIARAVNLTGSGEPQVIEGRDLRPPDQSSEDQRRRWREADIFARVSPEQKLDLIELHQKAGSIVAMTGDGVNDAPALKKADIGIAMGRRGTQVAREAADMILRDDAFRSIVTAIEYGRAIFGNIRRFIVFLLSGNLSEILIVALAWLAGAPLPLLPLQILYLNLIGDVFPALALGMGRAEAGLMKQPPRGLQESLLPRRYWALISIYGILIALAVLAVFWLVLGRLGFSPDKAVTVSFLTLSFSRLWHVFNMRNPETGVLRNEITGNPLVWAALGLCILLLLLAVYWPGLSAVLSLVDPGGAGWILVLAASLSTLLLIQFLKSLRLLPA